MSAPVKIKVKVNGVDYEREVEPRLLLSDFLRHDLELIGTHVGDVSLGIWYPAGLLCLAFVVGLLFLPETRNTPLEH